MYNHTKVHPECLLKNYETDVLPTALTRHLPLYKLVLLIHFTVRLSLHVCYLRCESVLGGSEVYMISDIINLLHHFSYVLTLLLQDGLNAFLLAGSESNGGLLRTQYRFHLLWLIVFFHSNPFDGIAQMLKLIRY